MWRYLKWNEVLSMTKMTRLTALLLTVLLVLSMIPAAVAEGPLAGGWTAANDPTVTQERSDLFDKALDGMVGVDYTPVAYLGSQVVAGTNHYFLCLSRVVIPDAIPKYVLVFIYEDLQGSAKIMNIADFDFGSFCTYGAEE
jgi:hypothetical protein